MRSPSDVPRRYQHRLGSPATSRGIAAQVRPHGGRIAIPTIALAELLVWAYGKADPDPVLKLVQALLDDLTVLEFDVPSAYEFGKLRVKLQRAGITVSPPDLMIASMALAHGLILVTDNTSHFATIPGLRLENWLVP